MNIVNSIQKKKILIYSPIYYPDIGGPAVQARFLSELLVENGYEVMVLKYAKESEVNSLVQIYCLNWNSNPSFFGRLYRWIFGPLISFFYLLKVKPNLVLVNSVFWNGMIMGSICRLLRIPTILKFTGDWVFESTHGQKDSVVALNKIYSRNLLTRIMRFLEKKLIEKFTVIWVISIFRYTNVSELTKKPKIWLQRNFHDLPKPELLTNNRFVNPLIFITSARLIPHKRINFLIEAISVLPNECKLIVVGNGSEFDNLKNLTERLELTNRVVFLGKISTSLLYYLMSNSSAYLSWSAEEGAPNSFIEALNFGLPILSANVGGISEMCSANSNAIKLFDPNNFEGFKLYLKTLEKNPGILQKMSNEALVESVKFSKEANKGNFLELFSQLISNTKF
jgi:glycosyltransferase involved in cell wall biosynthesis